MEAPKRANDDILTAMLLYLIAFLVPAIMVAVAVPLLLNAVPPNGLYGFRTPKTLSSPDIWYPANRRAGWYMIGASLLAVAFNLVLWSTNPNWPEKRLALWMANTAPAALILALLASMAYLRRL